MKGVAKLGAQLLRRWSCCCGGQRTLHCIVLWALLFLASTCQTVYSSTPTSAGFQDGAHSTPEIPTGSSRHGGCSTPYPAGRGAQHHSCGGSRCPMGRLQAASLALDALGLREGLPLNILATRGVPAAWASAYLPVLSSTAAPPNGLFNSSEATLFAVGPWPWTANTTVIRSSSPQHEASTPHSKPHPQANAADGRAPQRRLAVSGHEAASGRTSFRTQLLGEGAGQPQLQAVTAPAAPAGSSPQHEASTPHSKPHPQANAADGRAPQRRLAVSGHEAASRRTSFRTQLLGEGAGQPQLQAVTAPAAPAGSKPPPPASPSTPGPTDAWVVSTEELGQLAVSPGALDLTHLVRADPWVHWHRGGLLHPYELLLYRHGGRAMGLPLGISTQLLYYNSEALQVRGITVPQTWDELLHAAGTMHEQDIRGDGSTAYGICVVPEESSVPYGEDGDQGADAALWLPVLVDVWASIAQTAGPEQGLWFSPQDLSPWVDGPGVWEALRVTAALRALAPAADTGGVKGSNVTAGAGQQQHQQGTGSSGADGGVAAGGSRGHVDLALQGRCAFTIAPGLSILKAASRTSYMYGRLGAAPLPGSTRVWSPASTALVPCTGEICPYGVPAEPLVNRAQLVRAPATMVLSNNASSRSLGRQLATYALASSYLEPDRAFRDVLNPNSGANPWRYSHLSDTGAWVQSGYHPDDATAVLSAYGEATSHGNHVLPLAVPGSSVYMVTMRQLLSSFFQLTAGTGGSSNNTSSNENIGSVSSTYAKYEASAGSLADSIMGDPVLLAKAAELTRAAAGNISAAFGRNSTGGVAGGNSSLDVVLAAYRSSLQPGWLWRSTSQQQQQQQPPPAGGPGPVAQGGNDKQAEGKQQKHKQMPGWALGIILACGGILGFVLLAMGHYLLTSIRRGFGAGLRRQVLPPGPSVDLTLLLSDVEGSTSLWEAAPPAVMDAAMRLVAVAFRQLLLKHNGYESATEGDAFICAFSCPKDAVAFSVALQARLLELPWPKQLLQMPEARELHVLPHPSVHHTPWETAPLPAAARGPKAASAPKAFLRKPLRAGLPSPMSSVNGGAVRPGELRSCSHSQAADQWGAATRHGSSTSALGVPLQALFTGHGPAKGAAGSKWLYPGGSDPAAGSQGDSRMLLQTDHSQPLPCAGAMGTGSAAQDLYGSRVSGIPRELLSTAGGGSSPRHADGRLEQSPFVQSPGHSRLALSWGHLDSLQASPSQLHASRGPSLAIAAAVAAAASAGASTHGSGHTDAGDSGSYLVESDELFRSQTLPGSDAVEGSSHELLPVNLSSTSFLLGPGLWADGHGHVPTGQDASGSWGGAHGCGQALEQGMTAMEEHQVSAGGGMDYRAAIRRLYPECPPGTPGSMLVYRGLRLRLGLHCGGRARGVDIRRNKASARVIYGGQLMATARVVSNACHGGAIATSEPTRQRLLAARQLHFADTGVLLYMGHFHEEDEKQQSTPLPLPLPCGVLTASQPASASASNITSGAVARNVLLPAPEAAVHSLSGPLTLHVGTQSQSGAGEPQRDDAGALIPAKRGGSQGGSQGTGAWIAGQRSGSLEVQHPGTPLYQVVGGRRSLLTVRAAYEQPLSRAGECVALGALSVPVGNGPMAIGEVRIATATSLASFSMELYERAVQLAAQRCRTAAMPYGVVLAVQLAGPKGHFQQQQGHGGGVVVVGVSHSVGNLVAWSLECTEALLELPWSEGLPHAKQRNERVQQDGSKAPEHGNSPQAEVASGQRPWSLPRRCSSPGKGLTADLAALRQLKSSTLGGAPLGTSPYSQDSWLQRGGQDTSSSTPAVSAVPRGSCPGTVAALGVGFPSRTTQSGMQRAAASSAREGTVGAGEIGKGWSEESLVAEPTLRLPVGLSEGPAFHSTISLRGSSTRRAARRNSSSRSLDLMATHSARSHGKGQVGSPVATATAGTEPQAPGDESAGAARAPAAAAQLGAGSEQQPLVSAGTSLTFSPLPGAASELSNSVLPALPQRPRCLAPPDSTLSVLQGPTVAGKWANEWADSFAAPAPALSFALPMLPPAPRLPLLATATPGTAATEAGRGAHQTKPSPFTRVTRAAANGPRPLAPIRASAALAVNAQAGVRAADQHGNESVLGGERLSTALAPTQARAPTGQLCSPCCPAPADLDASGSGLGGSPPGAVGAFELMDTRSRAPGTPPPSPAGAQAQVGQRRGEEDAWGKGGLQQAAWDVHGVVDKGNMHSQGPSAPPLEPEPMPAAADVASACPADSAWPVSVAASPVKKESSGRLSILGSGQQPSSRGGFQSDCASSVRGSPLVGTPDPGSDRGGASGGAAPAAMPTGGVRLKAAVGVVEGGRLQVVLAGGTGRLSLWDKACGRLNALAEAARPGQVLVTEAAVRWAMPGRPGGVATALSGQQQQLLPRHMRLRQQLANAVRAMQRPSSAGGSSAASASAATPSASRCLSPTAPPPSALSSPGPRAAPSLGLGVQSAPSPLGCALTGFQPTAASFLGDSRAEPAHAATAVVSGSLLGCTLSGLQPCEGDARGGVGASSPARSPVAPAQPAGEQRLAEGLVAQARSPNRAKANWSTVARLLLPTRGAAAAGARVSSTAPSSSTGSPSCVPQGSGAGGQGSTHLDWMGHPHSPPSPDAIPSPPSTPTGWQSVLAANRAHAGSGSTPGTVGAASPSPSRDSRSPSALSDTEVAGRAASGGTTTHGSTGLWRSVSALPSGHNEAAGALSSSPTAGSPPDGNPMRMALLKGMLSARRRQDASPTPPLAGAHSRGVDGPGATTAASPRAAGGTGGQEAGSSVKLAVRRNGVGGGQERQVQVVFRAVAGRRQKGRKRGQEGQGVFVAQWSVLS